MNIDETKAVPCVACHGMPALRESGACRRCGRPFDLAPPRPSPPGSTIVSAPSTFIVEHAVRFAAKSPCAKTRRGAVVFHGDVWLGMGYNHPPAPMTCDRSLMCRVDCGRRCVHAETHAIRQSERPLTEAVDKGIDVEIVHVKIDSSGNLVAGGGPSCWQCSREILDAGIAAVWLYRLPTVAEANAADVYRADDPRHVLLARWQRYTAVDFHRITCANAKGGAVYVGGEQ